MDKKFLWHSTAISIVLALGLLAGTDALAGTKDMVAGKRVKFQDDNVESMRDVFERRELEDKEYRTTMIRNSKKSLKLLGEIRDLLEQLNAKD